jgi:metal-dependent hydrolase (beta-lactamase superfamily II)
MDHLGGQLWQSALAYFRGSAAYPLRHIPWINPDYLIPMHCTGFRTMMAIEREMPQKLILPSTGTRVVFGG